MRLFQFAAIVSVFCCVAGLAATSSAGKAQAKKATSTSKKKAAAPSSSKAKVVVKGAVKGGVKTKKAPVVANWRTRQQSPTADRYREIQQALVSKGYLKSEPTGVWDDDSVGAMQRFQMDQKLTPTGKINAPSLIGLGLGAKSAGAPEAPSLPGAPGPPPQTGTNPAAAP